MITPSPILERRPRADGVPSRGKYVQPPWSDERRAAHADLMRKRALEMLTRAEKPSKQRALDAIADMTDAERERFDSKWMPEPNTGCHLWFGPISNTRGQFKYRGWPLNAPRVAWILANGPIPDGMCVCHKCDTPPCCNHDHLFLGTHQENMADRNAKGRQRAGVGDRNGSRTHPEKLRRGELATAAKLTADAVRAIRASTDSHTVEARKWGVGLNAVKSVRLGRTWRHV